MPPVVFSPSDETPSIPSSSSISSISSLVLFSSVSVVEALSSANSETSVIVQNEWRHWIEKKTHYACVLIANEMSCSIYLQLHVRRLEERLRLRPHSCRQWVQWFPQKVLLPMCCLYHVAIAMQLLTHFEHQNHPIASNRFLCRQYLRVFVSPIQQM